MNRLFPSNTSSRQLAQLQHRLFLLLLYLSQEDMLEDAMDYVNGHLCQDRAQDLAYIFPIVFQ